MAITNLPTALTSAGNQGDAGDYSTAASTIFQIDYSGLDYTPKTTDDYKNDFEEELQVFINGIRIYRTATDTGIGDDGGLNTNQQSRLTNLNSSFGDKPWNIVTGTKKVQINQNHTAFSDSNSNNPGYPDLSTWTIIKVIRIKPDKTTLATDFQSASVLTEAELDNAFSETFHMAQEAIDTSLDSIVKGADNVWNAQSLRIKNVATPVNANDAVNKGFIDQNGNVSTVAGLSTEIARLGTSEMATATTGHIPVLANVVEQTVNYTVTVADNSGDKFHIQGGEYGSATSNPALTLIRGYTYVFDVSDSNVAGHPLVFINGSTTLGTSDGVTTTGTAGQAGAKVTVVVSDSVTITKYSCSVHGDDMGNTITLRHDDFKEVADVVSNVTTVAGVASSIPTVAGINSEITTVANSAYKTDIETVADSTYKSKVETVADSAYKAKVETVADSTYKAKVETVAGDTTAINSIHTNISQVTTFADTYHTAGTTEPSGSNVTEGDLWYDTANDVLKVYDGSSWVSASSSIATVASQNEFTASNGQGTGNKYFALNHDVGLELVFLNGVRLKRGSDYYCTNSNTSTTPIASGNAATFVRLETVPGSSDILSVMAFGQIANNLAVNTAGGTFTGGVTFEAGTTHNTGNNTFTLPTTRGTDGYVLTRDDTVDSSSGIGTTWKETTVSPTITSITYPTQNGVQATALAATGAQDTTAETLLINGQNLGDASTPPTVQIQVSGSYVTFAGTVSCNATGTVVTCANVTKQASADNYALRLTHGSNNLTAITTVNFSADPSFTTASGSLGTVFTGSAMSTKTITAGSSVSWYEGTPTMPTWMTHFADGASGTSQNLTGTPTNTGTSEVQNFNIIIRDSENQSHNRDFSLTVVDPPSGTNNGTNTYSYSNVTYRYYKFTSDGTFQIYAPLTVDILLVGGGGSGGAGGNVFNSSIAGSGGGAGGLIWMGSLSLSTDTYDIEVGDGGVVPSGTFAESNGSTQGHRGGDSWIANSSNTKLLTALGGGGGGGAYGHGGTDRVHGGSGGGKSTNQSAQDKGRGEQTLSTGLGANISSDSRTYGFGNDGGGTASGQTQNYGGSGGGGADSAGSTSTSSTSTNGGGGKTNFINNSVAETTALMNATSLGDNGYLAGGGGGGAAASTTNVASGGSGGGGNGAGANTNATAGTSNTGGGGGGGAGNGVTGNPSGTPGAGGSGVVVIRYAI